MKLEQLIIACKRNDPKARELLYHQFKDVLFTLCLKYCSNRQEAEDNLQDTFLTVFKNIHQYKGKGSFEGWLKRVTINKAIDRYKKQAFINVIINEAITEDTKVDDDQMRIPLQTLLRLIQELPTRYRLIFNLYELDDYSHKEIASMLNISVSTSKSNLHRAKLILKQKIVALNEVSQTNGCI